MALQMTAMWNRDRQLSTHSGHWNFYKAAVR